MSAFICSDAQFATVARWLFADDATAQRFADHLKRENVRSVKARYGSKNRARRVNLDTVTLDDVNRWTGHDIAAMLACIDYQSCEHDDYNDAPLKLAQRLLYATGADKEQSTIWSI